MRIDICGGIASGKTTLCQVLSARGARPIYEEFKKNPFWELFYADPVAYAFETELTFMLQHYSAQKELDDRQVYICDYSMTLDLAYADVNLSGNRLELFEAIATELQREVGFPDVLVRLLCPENVLLERIRKRSRSVESVISFSYLKAIDRALSKRVASLSVPVVYIDSNACDYTNGAGELPKLW